MIRCDRCSAPSIIFQRYSGLHLCKFHFEEDVHRKIRETIRESGVLRHGGRLAVAVSGGKDSSTLLYTIKKLFSKRPDLEIVAVLIDEGIDGYREGCLAAARSLCKELEVEIHIRSFQKEFGITTDEMASMDGDQGPCTFCGVFRKTLLNRTARELGAYALATGHNLDDEAQTVLLNYLRGDVDRLFRLRPSHPQDGMVPRVKPLRRVPEKETALYAITHDIFPFGIAECPHVPRAMRLEVKQLLNDFDARHPGTKYSLLKGLDRIMQLRPEISFKASPCCRCGEPTAGDLCQACRLLDWIGGAKPLSPEDMKGGIAPR